MTDEKELWEKQKNEPNKSYALFCKYRDLGPFRSIDKATEKLRKDNNESYTPQRLRVLSSQWNWVKRAEAYDEYMEQILRKEREQTIIEMTNRHADQSKEMQEEIFKSMKDPAVKREDIGKAGWFRNANIHSYVKAAKLERLSRGLPSDKVESEIKQDVKQDVKVKKVDPLKDIENLEDTLKGNVDEGKL